MGWSNWHALRSIVRRTSREATRPDHDLPDLRTRFLRLPRKLASRQVQSAIEKLGQSGGGWRIDDDCCPTGPFHMVRSRLLRWCVSDVTIWLWPVEDRADVFGVDVVSASRGGIVDFGQNARNIRDFYRALEAIRVERQAPSASH